MPQQLIIDLPASHQPNHRKTVCVEYFYLYPVSINFDYMLEVWNVSRNGFTYTCNSEQEVIPLLEKMIQDNDGHVDARPVIRHVTIFKPSYQRKAETLTGDEWRAIATAIENIPPRPFTDAKSLFDFCRPNDDV